ncbi:LacI family DNA-binding transcriptional regulator [Catellatospora bangladeshensis]|uniref:LacI family DNA-binding transcriptional regulator n=1 Tax=Catellatospora bangladeshensis TaxID=310355 RepID=UPI003616627E
MPRTSSTRTPGSAVTLQQVATAAGVSLATASRVLHGSGGRRVAEALAERVTAAAAELRYVAHAPAQSLARSRSTVVGVLVHDIADPYFAAIAAGAMGVAREHDLMVLVANTFRDPALERDYLARLRAQRPARCCWPVPRSSASRSPRRWRRSPTPAGASPPSAGTAPESTRSSPTTTAAAA